MYQVENLGFTRAYPDIANTLYFEPTWMLSWKPILSFTLFSLWVFGIPLTENTHTITRWPHTYVVISLIANVKSTERFLRSRLIIPNSISYKHTMKCSYIIKIWLQTTQLHRCKQIHVSYCPDSLWWMYFDYSTSMNQLISTKSMSISTCVLLLLVAQSRNCQLMLVLRKLKATISFKCKAFLVVINTR